MQWCLLAIILMTGAVSPSLALDRRIETRFTQELKKQITIGEFLELKQNDDVFLGIYVPAHTPRSRGGIVLVHNLGAHADWPEAIAPLRAELPKYGWNTLSIQLPLLPSEPRPADYEALFADGAERIKIALDHYNTEGIYNVLIIGQGMGATIALDYVANQKGQANSSVTGFVGLSMHNNSYMAGSIDPSSLLKDIEIPVLEVYGSLDIDPVIDGVAKRKNIARKLGINNYMQIKLIGADHRYTGIESTLVKRIRSWIDRYAPSIEIDVGSKAQR